MRLARAAAAKNINDAAAKKTEPRKKQQHEGGDTMIFLDEIKSEVSRISKQIIEMGNSL